MLLLFLMAKNILRECEFCSSALARTSLQCRCFEIPHISAVQGGGGAPVFPILSVPSQGLWKSHWLCRALGMYAPLTGPPRPDLA